jgi:hypothetical protein
VGVPIGGALGNGGGADRNARQRWSTYGRTRQRWSVPMGVGPSSGGVSEGVSPDSLGAQRAIIRATPTRPNILHFILFPPYYIGPSWLEGRLSETLFLTLGHIIQLRNQQFQVPKSHRAVFQISDSGGMI